jgi:hypothetical protein
MNYNSFRGLRESDGSSHGAARPCRGRWKGKGAVAAGTRVVFELFETSPCFAHHSGVYSTQRKTRASGKSEDRKMAKRRNKADEGPLPVLLLQGVLVSESGLL